MKRVDFYRARTCTTQQEWLAANAPATTLFNGVQLTAEATGARTPDDIVRQYWRGMADHG